MPTVKLGLQLSLLRNSRYGNELMGYATAGGRSGERLELTHRDNLPYALLEDSQLYNNYIIREGDRIDNLAFHYLEDSRMWWVLADLNPETIRDPGYLEAGKMIRIPNKNFMEQIGLG